MKQLREEIERICGGHPLASNEYTKTEAILSIEIAPNFTLKELIEKATVMCDKCQGDGQKRTGVEGFGVAIEERGCPKCKGEGSIIQPEGLVRL